jgi:hypothetical protein
VWKVFLCFAKLRSRLRLGLKSMVLAQKDSLPLFIIKGDYEIRVLILTGGRARRGEQLFSLPIWRKTLRNGLKKWERFS